MMHLLAASPPFQTAHRQGSGWGRQRAGIRRGGVCRGGGQRAAAEDTCQRCDFPGSDFRGVPVGAAWKPDGVTAAAASQFVDVLAQTCAMENGESHAPEIELKQLGSRQK